MTPKERMDLWIELWKVIIPLLGVQLTALIVAGIHAWASANRGRTSQQQNEQILQQVSEVKGVVNTIGGTPSTTVIDTSTGTERGSGE